MQVNGFIYASNRSTKLRGESYNYIFYFSTATHVMVHHLNRLDERLFMSTTTKVFAVK